MNGAKRAHGMKGAQGAKGVKGDEDAFWATDYDTTVFINCPFTADFNKNLHAIALAVICCGMKPRIATTAANSADPRLERLALELCSCRYSIHDLSLLKEDPSSGVARMNMPLELGMALAIRRSRPVDDPRRHDLAVLVRKDSNHDAAASDLRGNDLKQYGERVELVEHVMDWLGERARHVRVGTDPQSVDANVETLLLSLQDAAKGWSRAPWWKTLEVAHRVARDANLLPSARPEAGP